MVDFKNVKAKLSNKNVKTLLDNFLSLSALNLIGYIFPVLTLPYLAQVLGLDKIGQIAFASSIIIWLQTISDWGFNFSATRDIARHQLDLKKVSEIFNDVMWAKIFLTFCSFILLSVAVFCIPIFCQNAKLLYVTFLLVIGNTLFPQWIFQGMEKMRFITILNLISKIFFTIAVFLFIKEQKDFILQPLFTALGFVVAGVMSLCVVYRNWGISLGKPNFNNIISKLQASFDIFLNQLIPNLYNNFSTMLLGILGGGIPTGKLDGGSKFVAIGGQLNSIISRVFFPFLARRIDKHTIYAKISLALTGLITVSLYIFAPLIIRVFLSEEFNDSIIVLRIMSLSLIFMTLSSVYGTNFLILKGKEKVLRKITLLASLCGFIMAYPLIYKYSYIGAALNITITRGLLGISVFLYSKKI